MRFWLLPGTLEFYLRCEKPSLLRLHHMYAPFRLNSKSWSYLSNNRVNTAHSRHSFQASRLHNCNGITNSDANSLTEQHNTHSWIHRELSKMVLDGCVMLAFFFGDITLGLHCTNRRLALEWYIYRRVLLLLLGQLDINYVVLEPCSPREPSSRRINCGHVQWSDVIIHVARESKTTRNIACFLDDSRHVKASWEQSHND